MSLRSLAQPIFLCALIPMAASADHLPEDLHATGKAETTLAGISITRRGKNVSEAIERYGAPTAKTVAANNPAWIGYRWTLKNATLEVDASRGKIIDVYIERTGPGPALGTGAGVKLGDDLKRLKSIYGDKYEEGTYPDVRIGGERKPRSERIPHTGVWENHRVTIQWKNPEYTLTAGIDDHGKIVSLWLLRPECFPGECN